MSRIICSTGTGFSPRAFERRCGLIPAPAAHLDQLIDHPPRKLRAVHLAQRGLDADIVGLVIGEAAGDVEYRLQTERAAGDERQFLRDRVVLADRPTPLHALG